MKELRELVEKLAKENIQLRLDMAELEGRVDKLYGEILLMRQCSVDGCE